MTLIGRLLLFCSLTGLASSYIVLRDRDDDDDSYSSRSEEDQDIEELPPLPPYEHSYLEYLSYSTSTMPLPLLQPALPQYPPQSPYPSSFPTVMSMSTSNSKPLTHVYFVPDFSEVAVSERDQGNLLMSIGN